MEKSPEYREYVARRQDIGRSWVMELQVSWPGNLGTDGVQHVCVRQGSPEETGS